MKVDCDKALKPAKKLRKLLKDFPAHPTVAEVHALRTQCRKVEATAHALALDRKYARKLLKAMKPLRRAAGHVRDLDVLIGKAAGLRGDIREELRVLLVEQMAERRLDRAKRLHKRVKGSAAELRRILKAYESDLKKQVEANGDAESPAAPQLIAAELDHWPKLHAANLHDFRIRAKELRYMLQLSPDTAEPHLEALRKVKDEAGEWHDWLELEHLAQEILESQQSDGLLRAIHKTTREHLRNALTIANAVRKQGISQLLPA